MFALVAATSSVCAKLVAAQRTLQAFGLLNSSSVASFVTSTSQAAHLICWFVIMLVKAKSPIVLD